MSLLSALLIGIALAPRPAFAAPADDLHARLEASSPRPLVLAPGEGSLFGHGFAAGPYLGAPADVAQAFLAEHRALLGIEPDPLRLSAVLPARGGHIVRLQRVLHGLPVEGAFVALRVTADGRVTMLRAARLGGLSVDPNPLVLADEAATRALEAAALPGALDAAPAPVLVILPRGGEAAVLAWRVALSCAAPLRSVVVTVDAHSGAVLGVADRRRDARGWVWEQSPLDGQVIEVELEDLADDTSAMDGSLVTVENVVFDNGEQGTDHLALVDENGDFFYEPDEDAFDDPFAEVHAYYHIHTIRSFFRDTLGHPVSGPLKSWVNYRESALQPYDNAFYTQDMMGNDMLVFGQGSLGDFSYDTDIIAHEHGHAVVEARTSFPQDFIVYDEYGWNNAIGGIHEGIADFWAGSYQGDSLVGEYIPVRDMDNDATCPEDLTGESHDDGEIVGGATWAMVGIVGQDAADLIVYEALGMLSSSPSFAELAETMLAVAAEMEADGALPAGQTDAVRVVMEERGMLRCGRALTLVDGEAAIVQVNLVMGLTELPESMCDMAHENGFALTMPFQLAYTTPPASEGEILRLVIAAVMERLDGRDLDEEALDYAFYLRKDAPITFEMESVQVGGGFSLDVPHALDYDLIYEGNPRSIVIEPTDIALESGATYYLAMRHMNCVALDMAIMAQAALEAPPADTGDDGEPKEGCGGCSARPTGAPPAAAWLAGLLGLLGTLALGRRRR